MSYRAAPPADPPSPGPAAAPADPAADRAPSAADRAARRAPTPAGDRVDHHPPAAGDRLAHHPPAAAGPAAHRALAADPRPPAAAGPVTEKVHTFGDRGGLFGIVTTPAEPAAGRPALVILNAGLVHRAGPFRLHVDLARRLARRGFVTLRFDQSALGDSTPRPAGLSYEERAVLDAREAFDFLAEHYGARDFVVAGLCSGAMNAHRAAAADPRVVGMALLDGYAYRTRGYWRELLLPRLLDSRTWRARARHARRLLERSLRRSPGPSGAPAAADAGAAAAGAPGGDAADIFDQDWPPRPDVRRELEATLGRGVRALYVYTGGWSSYVFAGQFDEMFPALGGRERVRVRYFPLADHTYLLLDHREAMLREIDSFLDQFAP